MSHPTSKARIPAAATTLGVLALSAGSLSAMNVEQEFGPQDMRASFALESKHYDQGVVRVDDATMHGNFAGRWYDVGIQLDGWLALGQDTQGNPKPVHSLECTEVKARLDYLIEIQDQGMAIAQITPHYEWIKYPNQRPGPLNDHQHYVGVDAWFQPPLVGFEGIEFGGSIDFNADKDLRSTRGGFGSRQMFQKAPLDLFMWQTVTFGNAAYWRTLTGEEHSQLGTFEVGATLTHPLSWHETWAFVSLYGYYWLDHDQREANRNAGIDNGGVVISIGIQWVRENRR